MRTVADSVDILEVSRADLGVTRLIRAGLTSPEPGEVLFEVERFGLSANNVTYALLGDALRYWDLFPAAPGWGRVPVWAYLRVLASAVPGVEPGRRAFGLGPMATHVLLRPGRAGQATFTEGSAHRAGLSSVYNVYAWAPPGPPADDDALLVLRPLFWLSFTLDDYLARRPHPGRPVIVTSASSKAALGLAHLLTRRGVPVTGLTSARRVAFVDGLRSYGQVLSYALAAGAFSAPRHIRDLAREWGWPELERRYQAGLADFAAGAGAWLEIVRHRGLAAATRVYREVRAGAGPSAAAHVVDPVLRP